MLAEAMNIPDIAKILRTDIFMIVLLKSHCYARGAIFSYGHVQDNTQVCTQTGTKKPRYASYRRNLAITNVGSSPDDFIGGSILGLHEVTQLKQKHPRFDASSELAVYPLSPAASDDGDPWLNIFAV